MPESFNAKHTLHATFIPLIIYINSPVCKKCNSDLAISVVMILLSFYHVLVYFYPFSELASTVSSHKFIWFDFSTLHRLLFLSSAISLQRVDFSIQFVYHHVLASCSLLTFQIILCWFFFFFHRHPSYLKCVPCKYLQTQFIFSLKISFYHYAQKKCCKVQLILSLTLSSSLLVLPCYSCLSLVFILCLYFQFVWSRLSIFIFVLFCDDSDCPSFISDVAEIWVMFKAPRYKSYRRIINNFYHVTFR